MKLFKKEVDKDNLLYGGLIITFIILYGATAFVSWYHAITFFNIANAVWLSVLLSFVAEIGQASVLFSILLTENKHKFLPWAVMIILTTLQVIGNVVSSYDWIIKHGGEGVESFQKSILFFMTAADPEIFKVVIAWISGALLPIIALSMTALVAQNMELRASEAKTVLDGDVDEKKVQDFLNHEFKTPIDAKDVISEVSKVRPTQEDLNKLDMILKSNIAVKNEALYLSPEVQIERINNLIKEEKDKHPLGFTDEEIKHNEELRKEEINRIKEFMDNPVDDLPFPVSQFKSPGISTVEKDTETKYNAEEQKEIREIIQREDDKLTASEEIPPIIPHFSDEELHDMFMDEHERTGSYHENENPEIDSLDEEVDRLSSPLDSLNNKQEAVSEIIERPSPSSLPPPLPPPPPYHPHGTLEDEKKRIEDERLEKLRIIARDNLKKK
jgi:hypothetical protein